MTSVEIIAAGRPHRLHTAPTTSIMRGGQLVCRLRGRIPAGNLRYSPV